MNKLIATAILAASLAASIAPANAGFGPRDITPQDTSAGFGPRDLPEPAGPAFGPRDLITPDTAARSPWESFGTSTGESK
jgi:hypothetical protein